MSNRSIIRAVRGVDAWVIVDWIGLDAEAEQSVGIIAGDPVEFFRGDDNAPPENAQRGEIWEWRGVLGEPDSYEDDIGTWVCVGMVPMIEEATE